MQKNILQWLKYTLLGFVATSQDYIEREAMSKGMELAIFGTVLRAHWIKHV